MPCCVTSENILGDFSMTHLPGWRLMDRKVSTALIKMEKIRHVKKNPFGPSDTVLISTEALMEKS